MKITRCSKCKAIASPQDEYFCDRCTKPINAIDYRHIEIRDMGVNQHEPYIQSGRFLWKVGLCLPCYRKLPEIIGRLFHPTQKKAD